MAIWYPPRPRIHLCRVSPSYNKRNIRHYPLFAAVNIPRFKLVELADALGHFLFFGNETEINSILHPRFPIRTCGGYQFWILEQVECRRGQRFRRVNDAFLTNRRANAGHVLQPVKIGFHVAMRVGAAKQPFATCQATHRIRLGCR